MKSNQVLVIDDSRAIRLIVARQLRRLGIEVFEAENGQDALAQLAAGLAPAFILVDWNMPGMSGIEFVTLVRKPPYASAAKVIMVTTETEAYRMRHALEAGVDEYIMKPFTGEAIVEKLKLVGLV